MLTLRLDPALLADVRAVALEAGMEVGEWVTRSLRLAVEAAEAHALRQACERKSSGRYGLLGGEARKGGESGVTGRTR